jgi:CheY-like chemotaxis protein
MAHKLLLADDSVTIQRVIELTFADEDVQVIAVGDGKQAIERVQADRPDIVLADVGMPERDGYEVAAFIKGNPQLAHIPVLLLTGAFEPIDETRARAVGCDGVLVKPFEPQMVISRVKDLLSGRRPAGLWAPTPAAQTPVRPPAPPVADIDVRGPAAAAPAKPASDSLEDYFDRLDAAFSTVGTPAPEPPVPPPPAAPISPAAFREVAPPPPAPEPAAGPLDDLATWDPELTGDPARVGGASAPPPFAEAVSAGAQPWQTHAVEAHQAPPPPVPTPALPPVVPVHSEPVAAASMPPLSDAFAALLAAEQRRPIAPTALASVPEDTMDDIVRRVIDRMSGDTVRRTVVEVAERLVREEIERIKAR